MKLFLLVASLSAGLNAQQAPVPPAPVSELPADTVVAVSEGKKYTVGDVQKLVQGIPAQMRQNYFKDPKQFLNQYLLLKKMAGIAEAQKLHESSPYKEGIELNRMQVLFQAAMDHEAAKIKIEQDEMAKFYEGRKDSYTQAHLKIIYVPFVTSPAPNAEGKQRTEKEALAKAEELVKKARAGEDFTKLAQEHSEDPISREKGGDFGPIKPGDNLPEQIKQTVFKLKKDEVSDAVRQPNGYYIFRMQNLAPQPFDDVRDTIYNELKNQRLRQWMDGNIKTVELKVEKPEFFQSAAPR